jgi:chromosome segregation ATPase
LHVFNEVLAMAANGDERSAQTLERIEAKLDRLVTITADHSGRFGSIDSRFDAVENRLLKLGAVLDALGSKLDHTRSELLLRMDHLRVELLEAAQDEAKFAVTGQKVLAEHRLDTLEAQLDDLARRLEALEKAD